MQDLQPRSEADVNRMLLLREMSLAWVEAFKRSEAHWKREHKKPTCTAAEAAEAVLEHPYLPQLEARRP